MEEVNSMSEFFEITLKIKPCKDEWGHVAKMEIIIPRVLDIELMTFLEDIIAASTYTKWFSFEKCHPIVEDHKYLADRMIIVRKCWDEV